MVFSDGLTKANRLIELVFLFHRNPGRALTSAEIADSLGIAQRTARTYVLDLSSTGRLPVVRHRRGWRLADGARLQVPPVRFRLEPGVIGNARHQFHQINLFLRRTTHPGFQPRQRQ